MITAERPVFNQRFVESGRELHDVRLALMVKRQPRVEEPGRFGVEYKDHAAFP